MQKCRSESCGAALAPIYLDDKRDHGHSGMQWVCPRCKACVPDDTGRTVQQQHKKAALGYLAARELRYAEAENDMLEAYRLADDEDERAAYMWWIVACMYGAEHVAEVDYPNDPSRRRVKYVVNLARFPLPEGLPLQRGEALLRTHLEQHPNESLAEFHSSICRTYDSAAQLKNDPRWQFEVFIAWHGDEASLPFALKLQSAVENADMTCRCFVSAKALNERSTAIYEGPIYNALASARVLVVVTQDYASLGQKFLRWEVERVLRGRAADHVPMIFVGMDTNRSHVPAWLESYERQYEGVSAKDTAKAEAIAARILQLLRGEGQQTGTVQEQQAVQEEGKGRKAPLPEQGALGTLVRQAQGGDAGAQYRLASTLELGGQENGETVLAQDDVEALWWFCRAKEGKAAGAAQSIARLTGKLPPLKDALAQAAKGDVDALLYAGVCYEFGLGTETNVIEAMRLYSQAERQQDDRARRFLDRLLPNGYAGQLEEKLQKRGRDAELHYQLGLCYSLGVGCAPKPDQGMDHLEKAAQYGSQRADALLSQMIAEMDEKALRRRADTDDDPYCQRVLGEKYLASGDTALARQYLLFAMEKQPDQTRTLLLKATLKAADEAQQAGRPDEAAQLLKEAHELGDQDAGKQLGELLYRQACEQLSKGCTEQADQQLEQAVQYESSRARLLQEALLLDRSHSASASQRLHAYLMLADQQTPFVSSRVAALRMEMNADQRRKAGGSAISGAGKLLDAAFLAVAAVCYLASVTEMTLSYSSWLNRVILLLLCTAPVGLNLLLTVKCCIDQTCDCSLDTVLRMTPHWLMTGSIAVTAASSVLRSVSAENGAMESLLGAYRLQAWGPTAASFLAFGHGLLMVLTCVATLGLATIVHMSTKASRKEKNNLLIAMVLNALLQTLALKPLGIERMLLNLMERMGQTRLLADQPALAFALRMLPVLGLALGYAALLWRLRFGLKGHEDAAGLRDALNGAANGVLMIDYAGRIMAMVGYVMIAAMTLGQGGLALDIAAGIPGMIAVAGVLLVSLIAAFALKVQKSSNPAISWRCLIFALLLLQMICLIRSMQQSGLANATGNYVFGAILMAAAMIGMRWVQGKIERSETRYVNTKAVLLMWLLLHTLMTIAVWMNTAGMPAPETLAPALRLAVLFIKPYMVVAGLAGMFLVYHAIDG